MKVGYDAQFDSQKIVYHEKWLRRFNEDSFSVPPIYVEISPIGLCNHRCTFCAKDVMGYPNRSLSFECLEKFINELAELRLADSDSLGVKSLMFAGEGEPTLYKRLDEIIELAGKNEIETALTTNGTGMTEKFTQSTLPYLKWIKASINAGSRETYALVHQTLPEHWNLVWNNLARAVEIRRKFNYKCELGCQTVLLVQDTLDVNGRLVPANWREAPKLARKAKEFGLDHVVIKPYGQNPYSLGTKGRYGDMAYTGFLDDLEEMDQELSELNDDSFKVVFRWKAILSHESDSRGYQTCLATPMSWAYLQSDGMVISCAAHNSNSDFDLGNIKEKSFKEIWWGETRRKHVEFMKTFDISQCRKNCRMHFVNQALWNLKDLNKHELDKKLASFNSEAVPPNVNFI